MPSLFGPKPRPAAAPEAPQVQNPPGVVSKDDIKEMLTGALQGVATELAGVIGGLRQDIGALASRPVQAQVVTAPAAPTPIPLANVDAEIDQAILGGTGAAQRIRALIDRQVNEAADRIVKQHVAPLQQFGVDTLGEISRRVVTTGMPHYTRFRKEIDEKLGQLMPELRANPAAIDMVYKTVVGEHADELAREAAEAAIRNVQDGANDGGAERKTPKGTTPGNAAGARGQRDETDVPTVDSFGGELGLEALALKGSGGQNADEFARGMGYKDWSDYMRQHQELLNSESGR